MINQSFLLTINLFMNKVYPTALVLSILYLIAYVLLANLGILFHFETAL